MLARPDSPMSQILSPAARRVLREGFMRRRRLCSIATTRLPYADLKSILAIVRPTKADFASTTNEKQVMSGEEGELER